MNGPVPRLARAADIVQWLVGVAGATAIVLLFTLAGAPGATAGDSTANGQAIYAQRCALCHGGNGQGAVGPPLAGTVSVLYPNPAAEAAVVANGRAAMPAFATVLSTEEIDAVVRFTRDSLG